MPYIKYVIRSTKITQERCKRRRLVITTSALSQTHTCMHRVHMYACYLHSITTLYWSALAGFSR